MAFCEQCGAELTPGVRFCEQCGTAVDDIEQSAVTNNAAISKEIGRGLFSTTNWSEAWLRFALDADGAETGIILTREGALLEQINVNPAQLHSLIASYVDSAQKRGVNYCYLNLDEFPDYAGEGDMDSVVEALQEIVEVARPKYLFILGNEEVIDVACWDNEAADGDDEVESDLCYSTLDTESPWDGQEYDFEEVIRVGRLPTYSGESFEEFKSYFDTAMAYSGKLDRVVPYGLSALVWEDESNYEYGKIASRKVDVSPMVGQANVRARMGSESNLLFFNLHGSDQTRFWYGQDGGDYPEAFAPAALDDFERPYFIGVEACYGARYLGGLTPEDSVLLKAVQKRCMAFLGSSRIAFGTSSPDGSCADLVVGAYIKNISRGESAGDAYIAGLVRLAEDWDSMDDADIKTMAEFALYGDPSVRMVAHGRCGFKKLFASNKIKKGLSVPMPDVGRAVRGAITEVDAKIEAIIDDYVRCEVLPELAGAIGGEAMQSKIVRMSRTGLNQKIYSFRAGDIRRVAKVYFDDKGRVKRALLSK